MAKRSLSSSQRSADNFTINSPTTFWVSIICAQKNSRCPTADSALCLQDSCSLGTKDDKAPEHHGHCHMLCAMWVTEIPRKAAPATLSLCPQHHPPLATPLLSSDTTYLNLQQIQMKKPIPKNKGIKLASVTQTPCVHIFAPQEAPTSHHEAVMLLSRWRVRQ